MSSDINRVVVVGRLTRDSELKYSNSGLAILNFSIANNYRKKRGDEWTEEVNFFNCFMMGKRAEGISRYLEKGKQIAVDGELRFSRWEKDGQPRSKVEIRVVEIQLLGGNRSSGGSGGSGNSGRPKNQDEYNPADEFEVVDQGESSEPANQGDFEDDVPF